MRYLPKLALLLAISFLRLGNPGDYDYDGRLEYAGELKFAVSTFKNESDDKKYDFYASSIAALVQASVAEINWAYRPAPKPNLIEYPHRGKKFGSYRVKTQRLPIESKDAESLNRKHYAKIVWESNLVNSDLSYDSPVADVRNLVMDDELDLLIYGSYKVQAGTVTIRLKTFSHTLAGKSFEIKAQEKNIRQSIGGSLEGLKLSLANRELVKLSMYSTPSGARVYLNDSYIGLTPLVNRNVISGIQNLRVEKQGYSLQTATVKMEKDAAFKTELKAKGGDGQVRINTSPAGAKVYLGVNFAGFTPLLINRIPHGYHRLRISMDGHISEYRTVRVTPAAKDIELDVALKTGDTREYYKIRNQVLWGFTYYDFALYSFGGAVGSLIAGFLFQAESENTLDELRAEVPLNENDFTAADRKTVKKFEAEAQTFEDWAVGMQASTALFLGLALYFFIQYVELSDVEIASAPLHKIKPMQVRAPQDNRSWAMAVNYNF